MKPKKILDLENEFNVKFDEQSYFSTFDNGKNTFVVDNTSKIKALKIVENEKLSLKIIEFLCFDLEFVEKIFISKNVNLSFLEKCKKLKELHVKINSDENLFYVSEVLSIEKLGIEFSGVKKIELLENLTRLTSLSISNEIENISFVKKLSNISELFISFPSLLLDVSPISFLKNLKFLYIEGNLKIENLSVVEKLVNLEILTLYDCTIVDSSCLKGLTKLKSLQLRKNTIYDLSFLIELKRLKNISIEDNPVENISVLSFLTHLESIKITDTKLVNISVLQKLEKLKKVDLQNNDISDITDLLKNQSVVSVNLKGNKKVEIDFPKEVLEAGWNALKEFSLESREKIFFKNVKVLLLGNPNIGKSNLLEFLETNSKPVINDSTHGVKYKLLKLDGINFHFWDFGGQEYFHATHQLFFSRNAVNLLLWGEDIQRENSVETCFEIDYWLRIITQLNHGSDEVVFLTENKIDLNIPKYSEKKVLDKYDKNFKNLKFYESHISLMDMKNVFGFKEKILTISEEIINRFKYPKFYEVFWKRIEVLEKDYATIEEINNRPNKNNVIDAIKVFHNMGMLLYFSEIIPDKIFHKPHLLLELLYQKVLSREMKCMITYEQIKESISGNSLAVNVDEVVKLLKYFNLVFEIKTEKNIYIIPQYLPKQTKSQETFEKLGFSFCNIKIKADHYLMSLAMLKIFSKYGNYVDKDNNEFLFWHNGIVILKDEQTLLIKYEAKKQYIELYLAKDCNKSLQKEVVDFVLDLPEDYTLPKRNFENHIAKRWIDVMDENDPDFAPHFSERLEEYPGYYEEFLNRNWNKNYQWKSDFFDVNVSLDGFYFISWQELKNNENLEEINFQNALGELKKYTDKDYCHWIDKKIEMKNDKNKKEGDNYYFNAPGTAGIIGNDGKIENFNLLDKPLSENKTSVLNEIELEVIKKWKRKANIFFIASILITLFLLTAYAKEFDFIFTKSGWEKFKGTEWVKWIGSVLLFIWNSIIIKVWYERNFDSSKEKAFIELYKIKKSKP